MGDGALYWHWLVLGLVFTGVEIVAPGVYFIFFGAAAWAVALVVLLVPGLGWAGQLLAFAVAAGLAMLGARVWQRRNPPVADTLNRRGESYVGRIFTLEEPLADGIGHVRVDDTVWRVRSLVGDLPIPQRVRVTGVDGATLIVEPNETAAVPPRGE